MEMQKVDCCRGGKRFWNAKDVGIWGKKTPRSTSEPVLKPGFAWRMWSRYRSWLKCCTVRMDSWEVRRIEVAQRASHEVSWTDIVYRPCEARQVSDRGISSFLAPRGPNELQGKRTDPAVNVRSFASVALRPGASAVPSSIIVVLQKGSIQIQPDHKNAFNQKIALFYA
nr:hypothetical protein CFP56_00471 [Quercus suber]